MDQLNNIAAGHYPQIKWRDGQRMLWNPIQRKALKNLPEERVRLRVLEYLLHSGWSKHRISTEEAIDLPQKQAKHRTDLICYTDDFHPFLLIECKAENIKLSGKTAEQIARYNQKVSAPFLLMTNGQADAWFKIEDESVTPLNGIPDELPEPEFPNRDFSYWQQRGFAGQKAAPALRNWITPTLDTFFAPADAIESPRFLAFQNSPTDIAISNYYRIFELNGDRLALTLTSTSFGGNRMIGILNRKGENKALAEINLDLVFDDRTPNATVYWHEGPKNVDARQSTGVFASPQMNPPTAAENMHRLISELVD